MAKATAAKAQTDPPGSGTGGRGEPSPLPPEPIGPGSLRSSAGSPPLPEGAIVYSQYRPAAPLRFTTGYLDYVQPGDYASVGSERLKFEKLFIDPAVPGVVQVVCGGRVRLHLFGSGAVAIL